MRGALRSALGVTHPPERITQESFELDDGHLGRLVRLQPGERPNGNDLFAYTEDLRYTKVQGSLLAYLLPVLLEVWRDDVRGIENSYAGVVEHIYPILADRHVFDQELTPKQNATVSAFMRQVILEEIDNQRGLAFSGKRAQPYRWVREIATYGVILPDLESLWTTWWSLDAIGRAIAYIQYLSCFMYAANENPIFSPWTPDAGGGPPCLWEFSGHLYTHCWLEPNVRFLRRTLNVQSLRDLLDRATERLLGEPEHAAAANVCADFALCASTVEARCIELPEILGTPQGPGRLHEWST
jgi:hypothetical protein